MGFLAHVFYKLNKEIGFFQKLMPQNSSKLEFRILFGQQIKRIRTQKKLSLRQISLGCDLDFSDIGKYEKGEVNIQLTTVYELAKGLGVHPKELFDFEITE